MTAYVIKSAIYLSILYVPYMLMLQKESFFRLNRKMLLLIMALSLVLPLVNIPAMSWSENSVAEYLSQPVYSESYEAMPAETAALEVPKTTDWWLIVSLIYIIGAAVTLFVKLFQLQILRRKIQRGTLWTEDTDGIHIHCHIDDTVPYSWFKHIVISRKDYENNATEIIRHETGHIRSGHSWDILLLNIVQTVQWMNPLAWVMGDSLRDVHEFEADDYVLRSGIERSQYQHLLLSRAMNQCSYTFANGFNQSVLLKRFNMMVCPKSNPWMRAKYLYILPLALLAMAAFAHPEVSEEISGNVKQNLLHKDGDVFLVCEQMPTFPGGNNSLQQFISRNVQYPETAIREQRQGRVVVQFVIDSNGIAVEPNIVRSVSPELDAEALRVIHLLPKWNPGMHQGKAVAVRYNIPITFRLTDSEINMTTEKRLKRRFETMNL